MNRNRIHRVLSRRCKAAAVIALAALSAGCTSADQERRYRLFFGQTAAALVPGFELPGESEYGPLWAFVESLGWRTRDGSGATKAEFWTSGEFNGDGALDYAYILREAATDSRTLFAFVSTPGGYEALRLDAGFEWGIWLRTRPPGRYPTAAARGAGASPAQNVPAFEAGNQAIDLFQFEGAAATFVWNQEAKAFDRFVTSD